MPPSTPLFCGCWWHCSRRRWRSPSLRAVAVHLAVVAAARLFLESSLHKLEGRRILGTSTQPDRLSPIQQLWLLRKHLLLLGRHSLARLSAEKVQLATRSQTGWDRLSWVRL